MAKMYLEENNSGRDILITDENGKWFYSSLDNGFYGEVDVYEGTVEEAVNNLRNSISEGNTYSAEDWLYDYAEDHEPVYDGCMTIDDIDEEENYITDIYSGDRHPLDHDITTWYEV